MNFNGIDLSNYITIRKVRRDILPLLENFTISPPHMVGSYFTRKKIHEREISVDFFMSATSKSALRANVLAIAEIFNQSEPKTLYFNDEAVIYYAILAGSTDMEEILATSQGTLQFLCPDPYKYAVSDTVIDKTSPAIALTYNTPCVISATLAGSASYIEIGVGTDKVRFDYALISGDEVTVDTKNRTALLNGTIDLRPYKTITSEWIQIKTGTVNVVPLATNVSISYRERWL